MKIKRLGTTDLFVSELGFGAFAIGGHRTGNSYGPTDDATSIAAVHAALDLGCTFFDTADVYGYGHSEEVLGRALREARRTNDVVIASKVGGNFSTGRTVLDFSREHIVTAIDGSLRRLGRDTLDLYQLHNPPVELIRSGEAFDALDEVKRSGKIRHYGVSIHTAEEGEACIEGQRAEALQLVYNLFGLLEPESSLGVIFDRAVQRGVGLIAREPLAAGFLSGRHDLDTRYGAGDNRGHWPMGRRRLFVALANALRRLERPGVSLSQAALRFVLDEPAISTTIVGIKTPEQARENFGATQVPSFQELEASTAA
ncbi:aldo/keto reductase [Sorangium sp. So ce367]|uniref:aldo/keto reductase n=1 Tax=Sorangium sp. So ce367 TaxID=3133305 RepID=UPI003F64761A